LAGIIPSLSVTHVPRLSDTYVPGSYREHFERWWELFKETANENFEGEGADRANNATLSIAHTFAARMGLIDPMAGQML